MPKRFRSNDERREYNRERQAQSRLLRGVGGTRRFVGADGEGGQDASGSHQYYLLRVGHNVLATGQPLTGDDCLSFLCSLPTDVIYVAYFFDYDVTMILRSLPANRIEKILDREGRMSADKRFTFPVDYNEFQIDYLPHKEFRVRRRLPGEVVAYGPWLVINDVGSFFQCAFLKSLEEWSIGTAEERAMIADGKAARADFGQLTKDVIEYNALEIRLLEELMEAFRDVCRDVGYLPRKWQGPGNLASAMLGNHGVTKTKDLSVPTEVMAAANAAYYGGRFETTAVGRVDKPVWQYDINSAYPYSLTKMPCLVHGVWIKNEDGNTDVPQDGLALAFGHFRPVSKAMLYGFPVRSEKGTIFFPAEGRGWYWSPEIRSAVHQSFSAESVWRYRTDCDCSPFDWIPSVYQERLALGKTARGKVLKLALNSLYGKQAQSIGAAPYANPIYAGLITALTRTKLAEASHDNAEGEECFCRHVMMLATDAVFATQENTHLACSKVLGEWDRETHDGMFIVQPGLYFTSANTQPKTRGLPRQAVVELESEFRKAYAVMIATGNVRANTVRVPLRQFVGIRIASARGALHTAGEWVEVPNGGKEVSFEWSGKRDSLTTWFEGLTLRTVPKAGSPDLTSVPYSKDIGRLLERARIDNIDQPDWAPLMMGDDL